MFEMSPDRYAHKQSGAGLPIAIFIITVLALLVFGMAQVQQGSGESVSLQIQSQRAFFAAESGVQVSIGTVFSAIDAGDAPSCPVAIPIFNNAGLSGCSASFECSLDSASGRFVLTSTGSCGNGSDLASRTVEVRLQ